jgi:hypothetical protein
MPPFLQAGQPLAAEVQQQVIKDFHRDGFAIVRGVYSAEEVALVRQITDQLMDDPALNQKRHRPEGFILRNTLSLHPIFLELMMRQPVLSLAEAVLGEGCRFVGQNVIRNPPGRAIATWHVDDTLEFPLPPEIPRFDPRLIMPVHWLTIQMALSDLTSEEDGPTQFVPGSHYSGRRPNNQEAPLFDGQGPVSILCRAGDIYLQNNQCWHRGAPNTGSRTRYLTQTQYARPWAFTRFNEYNRVPVPPAFLEGAPAKTLHVLGLTGWKALAYPPS